MGVAIKTECVREINRLNRVDRTVRSLRQPKEPSKDFSRLAMQAARRVKSSKNKTKTTRLVCSHLKSLLLDGFGSGPKTATKKHTRPRRAVVHRVLRPDASIQPVSHVRQAIVDPLERQIGLPI